MAGTVTYKAPIESASGKILGKKTNWCAVTRQVGNRKRGCAAMTERNLLLKPYKPGEIAQHTAFGAAATKAKAIMADPTLSAKWGIAYDKAKKAGSEITSLRRFISSCIMRGFITETDEPNLA